MRPLRGRDAAGRPVPADSPEAVEPVPEEALPPAEALALARDLLARGRPFFAHDVLEAVWKTAPADERLLWQGLAQVCVGLTHLQRGNPVGAARLLRRGADRLDAHLSTGHGATGHGATGPARPVPTHRVDVTALVAAARARADRVEAGEAGDDLVLPL